MAMEQIRVAWAYGITDELEWGYQIQIPLDSDELTSAIAQAEAMAKLEAETKGRLRYPQTGDRVVGAEPREQQAEDD